VKKFFANMNPMLRGLLLIAAFALVIVVLNLQGSVLAISMLLRIAFFLAVAFFVYLLWRERREDIGGWSDRAQRVFYGAALLIVVDLGAFFWRGASGIGALAFILVLVLCGFSMFRVWRDEHTYS
jgi:hypothetical protein